MNPYIPGQRWMSETEPELGLGMVLAATAQQVTIVFRASGETRQYAVGNAPLKRVAFRVGDKIRGGEKEAEHEVQEIREEKGLFIYETENGPLPETLLSDRISLNAPQERLLAGQFDDNIAFELRVEALHRQFQIKGSPVRGFIGGRVDLIPHQLYIAHEVANRHNPRVLLADEVGLGKTIESCLILHRLLLTGRIKRALILVPESLVNQWLVELLRRFNIWFAIYDEERCAAIEANDPASNPFMADQLVLTHVAFPANSAKRSEQIASADWDLVIVDEAHHLHWSPEEPSAEYKLVEKLAANAKGLLLLTATPEQLGEASHFARLKLLDPNRYSDLDTFLKEAEQYHQVAKTAAKLLQKKKLTSADIKKLATALSLATESLQEQLATSEQCDAFLAELLDQHGPGRVMFRNTRAAVTGFPKRLPKITPIESEDFEAQAEAWADEFHTDADPRQSKPAYDFGADERVAWLADFLRANRDEKVLLICRYKEKVIALEKALKGLTNTRIALFHEDLPLIQRDRNAAWFAEEDGAQLLICSEIGSEGRNFQFSHRLVLFDLPTDPELLEQRIGRLDRIGQNSDIEIYVPYIPGTPQEALVRWYHEGLSAFSQKLSGGNEIYEKFGVALLKVAHVMSENATSSTESLEAIIKETKLFQSELGKKLESGRDRLLEMHSFQPQVAETVIAEIKKADADESLDAFIGAAFDHFGLHFEELGSRSFLLGGGDLFKEKVPALPDEGLAATCQRERALSREDVGFLSWDHPIVTSLLDMILGNVVGNSAFALWPGAPAAGVFMEAWFVLEAIAPAELQIERFLPPTPIRIVVNSKKVEVTSEVATETLKNSLKGGNHIVLSSQFEELGSMLPRLIKAADRYANEKKEAILQAATAKAKELLGHELSRLKSLAIKNKNIRPDEIEAAQTLITQVDEQLGKTTLRMDAVRLILASTST
ncbi:MAG: RNA polymerase-associated protein RapA [Verrucomicrobiales bacterium]